MKVYANRRLRPVEERLLDGHRGDLSGQVLELGCGAGRIAGYLVEGASAAFGIDVSSQMVTQCRARFPLGTFVQGDAVDLSLFRGGSFDAVVAGYNILDVFSDEHRRQALREARRVLKDGGLFIMSSHNRAYASRITGPAQVRTADPLRFAADLVRAPRRIWHHRRLLPFERHERDYAILSDGSHEYTLVHYYISREAQFRQLRDEGFDPDLCLDLDGVPVGSGETAPECPELHYVARAA